MAGNLTVEVDGTRTRLTAGVAHAAELSGQAGLATLRLDCRLSVSLTCAAEHRVQFANHYMADRIGWREITVVGDVQRWWGVASPR